MPELESSVRQLRQRDRDTSLLFRAGHADAAIERLREDGHAILVSGSRRHAVEAVADLWQARQQANAGREGFSLTVSAPTNSDAQAISAAIRDQRRASGDLQPDQVAVSAIDQNGATYELPLAIGDRVRLFARTNALIGNRPSNIGNNGSVLSVERIETKGMQLRNAKGTTGFVKWKTLLDPVTERIRLAYGDVITIDAIQSATSTEHINAMVGGSQAVQSFKGYVAQSRSRETTWLVAADGPERSEIMTRRALGNLTPIGESDVWANIGRNLSRQPEKELATDLLARAYSMNVGTVRDLATAFQPKQQREAEGREGTTLHRVYAWRRDECQAAEQAPAMQQAAAETSAAVQTIIKRLTGPQSEVRSAIQAVRGARRRVAAGEMREAIKAARRAMRPAAARPKAGRRPAPMSQTDAQAEFADALYRAGLQPKGAPIMDGQKHRVRVEGDAKGKRSGTYIGHLDDRPAGYIHNFKTGEEIRWSASRPAQELTPAEQAAMRERIDAERTARETARNHQEAVVSHLAIAVWNGARPASSHPYLTAKGIEPHGMRQDGRGNLLVPMHDVDRRLWGVQRIASDGKKLFMRNGRKLGTHAILGGLQPGAPLAIAEGLATAATIHEATGLATVAAFDSGNLELVARAYRERDPARPIVIAADDDHHLPRRQSPLPNVGQEKAAAAAQAVGGIVLTPTFAATDKGTDWNDYAAQHGKAAVRTQVEKEMRSVGIALPVQKAAKSSTTQADRDTAWKRSTAFPNGKAKAADQTARDTARAAQVIRPIKPR